MIFIFYVVYMCIILICTSETECMSNARNCCFVYRKKLVKKPGKKQRKKIETFVPEVSMLNGFCGSISRFEGHWLKPGYS